MNALRAGVPANTVTSAYISNTAAAEQYRLVTIKSHGAVLSDRSQAMWIRDRFLEPLANSPVPVVVDLNQIKILTMGGADELVGRWLEHARSSQRALITVFATYNQDVRDALNAVLFSIRQVAYCVRSLPSPAARPGSRDVLGDFPLGLQQTLDYLVGLPEGRATASEVARGLGLAKTAAEKRLNNLATNGLLFRLPSLGEGDAVFAYPWPQSERALAGLYLQIATGVVV